ncbi:hypothetical protein WS67_07490 [Burkholderia singularis]|uniref:Uncharacterized protein n=1 Tax=Burkholderia singularis TaxID=1503053 RepID=A0A124P9H9_9BURK|nr:hypothetical protein WS67_07490 [Burkholderia singularis]
MTGLRAAAETPIGSADPPDDTTGTALHRQRRKRREPRPARSPRSERSADGLHPAANSRDRIRR